MANTGAEFISDDQTGGRVDLDKQVVGLAGAIPAMHTEEDAIARVKGQPDYKFVHIP